MMKKLLLPLLALMFVASASATAVQAEEIVHSTVGVQGYGLVSYQTGKRPVQGNGNHLVTHDGVNYLFSSADNQEAFKKNPNKYLPAYGGWCAFGVSVNKKFIGDPTVWEIVDGKLYFNLDNSIKSMWVKDIPGNIKKADANWPKIKNKHYSDL
ncbi:MAG: YHS domain-containing protein [Gammaproteobacteria bacterium]|nr:MAG: YHS domain-containing protein [Gammaproteobacteria bacterium]